MVNKMEFLSQINSFIELEKLKINKRYRLKYHMMPPVGWMNDPNGLIYFNDTFHIFYQFNPYDTRPGKMMWGYFKSKDLIKYEDCGVAINTELLNHSIFSGGAIEVDSKLNAIYTLHFEDENCKKEEVYLQEIGDNNNKCIFDNDKLPVNISREDFRDPFPIKVGDYYYVFLGGKDINLNKGLIIVLRGKKIEELSYFSSIGPLYELGDMGECPSYHKVGDKDVLLVSGCRVKERDNNFKNENSSVFIVGKMNFENGEFEIDFIKEIDKGDTFYAPQFINGIEEPIMIGWLEMWGKEYPTQKLEHGYCGGLTIPRKLKIIQGDIYQEPIDSLSKYHQEVNQSNYGKCLDIEFDIKKQGEFKLIGDNGELVLGLNDYLYLDTIHTNNLNGCIRRTNHQYDDCHIRILLDVSSIEVFVSNGKEVISSRIYIDGDYQIGTNNQISNLVIRKVGVD